MNVMHWRRTSRLCFSLLAALSLAACDSSDDDGDGPNADFPGDPDMLGMWEMIDETTGQPFPSDYQFYVQISSSSNVTTFRIWEWDVEIGECWTPETSEVANATITPTTVSGGEFGSEPRRYTADQSQLAFYDEGVTAPDVLFRRSTRTASSFTPEC